MHGVMTDHLHLIIGTKGAFKLEDIIREFKRYTSKLILKILENSKEESKKFFLDMFMKAGKNNTRNKKYQFWQQHSHPIDLININLIDQKLEYIHYNPVKAGFVDAPSSW